MTDLEKRALHLQSLVENASHQDQKILQPRIARAIAALSAQGHPVPPRLRRINDTLKADAFDDMFDNMPI